MSFILDIVCPFKNTCNNLRMHVCWVVGKVQFGAILYICMCSWQGISVCIFIVCLGMLICIQLRVSVGNHLASCSGGVPFYASTSTPFNYCSFIYRRELYVLILYMFIHRSANTGCLISVLKEYFMGQILYLDHWHFIPSYFDCIVGLFMSMWTYVLHIFVL